MDNKTEYACKWATCGVLFVVFFGLVWLAGCINIVEFISSMLVASLFARLFYLGIRAVAPRSKRIPAH